MRYRILLETDEDGMWIATCPALPGCVSQGRSRPEALANIRDAMEACIASLEKHGVAVPAPLADEIVEVLDESAFDLSDEQRTELERRLAEHDAAPSSALDWKAVIRELEGPSR